MFYINIPHISVLFINKLTVLKTEIGFGTNGTFIFENTDRQLSLSYELFLITIN